MTNSNSGVKVTKYESEQKCHTVQDKVERQVPRQVCNKVPRKECKQVRRFVDWFMASFLYCFPYSYRFSNYCDSNSCRSFTFLKAIAKSKSTHIAIALKREKVQ